MSVTPRVDALVIETQKAVNEQKVGSWRALGRALDIPHSILYAIGIGAFEHVSWATLRRVRTKLGLDDPGELVTVTTCPSCGDVHVANCRGQPGAPTWRKPRRRCVAINEDWLERYRESEES